eukprot:m.40289 g.40289  ORF g.40289 m.40289 type:complete len:341 (-) comp16731_c0_seq1:260-1282(-)
MDLLDAAQQQYLSFLKTHKLSKHDGTAGVLKVEANVFFQSKQFDLALAKYTKSLFHANPGEAFSITMANRALCLLAMNQPALALRDATFVLDTGNYPPHLTHKMTFCQARCYQQVGNLSDCQRACERTKKLILQHTHVNKQSQLLHRLETVSPTNTPASMRSTSTRKPPPVKDFISRDLRLQQTSTAGKEWQSLNPISPGSHLLSETCLAAILEPSVWATHCFHCLQRCTALLPCTVCCFHGFCSTECQATATNEYHFKHDLLICELLYARLPIHLENMSSLKLAWLASRVISRVYTLGEIGVEELLFNEVKVEGCGNDKGNKKKKSNDDNKKKKDFQQQ